MAGFDELAVKDYPCLYNTKSSDFKISWKKENAWTAISKQLNTTGKQNTTGMRQLAVLHFIKRLK